MKTRITYFIILSVFFYFSLKGQNIEYDPYVALEFDLGIPLQFVRSSPVNLGEGQQGFVLLFSEERNLDPWEENFFFPKHTPKLALFSSDGAELWRRELPGALPGTWFIPVLPFDMNKDGVDEIYYVNNVVPRKPFSAAAFRLECADPLTGEVIDSWPWTAPSPDQSNSDKWRFFLIGGYVQEEPVLVTTQGTYKEMKLQAWNADMSLRWEIFYPNDWDGPRGSHNTPVLDIGNDNVDEFMYGERCISFDTGEELFVLDREVWNNHSDVVLPIYNSKKDEWEFFTTREKGWRENLPRAVMFDQRGKHLWAIKETQGHYHYGWVANLGLHGERIAMAGRYNLSDQKAPPDVWFFDSDTGVDISETLPLNIRTARSTPIDFNGDGIHELLIGRYLYSNSGNKLFDFGEGMRMLTPFKVLDLPGEQIMCFYPEGIVRIWADRNANDTEEMKKRFTDNHYINNVRHSASGYNNRFVILNY